MTINFELLDKLENDRFLIFLARINQISTTWLIDNLTKDIYSHFEAQSWIRHIKQKNKEEHLYNSLRLSDKGRNYLRDLFKESDATEEDKEYLKRLTEYYISKGKEIGNPNRVLSYLIKFRTESGISGDNLTRLFADFLSSDYVDEKSRNLEYILFYPKKFTTDKGKTIAYEAKWDLYDSWLYKHYLQNKNRLDLLFNK
jgi:hypothetical protein